MFSLFADDEREAKGSLGEPLALLDKQVDFGQPRSTAGLLVPVVPRAVGRS